MRQAVSYQRWLVTSLFKTSSYHLLSALGIRKNKNFSDFGKEMYCHGTNNVRHRTWCQTKSKQYKHFLTPTPTHTNHPKTTTHTIHHQQKKLDSRSEYVRRGQTRSVV
ncbi:hypothetical protein CY34DRAFT_525288 [Suillus luteus UH-Slu-Lm8-n1]|uniref:Uncharacterized protein n=1 Tax=Suillus luteus UH-Slu-Lm8-n1 TaxID=930992 RepID=A0A0D0APW7_9AGAM|nr:hypothetical protein CY34DRAFT_525288 [Suillus luteus UH-Slu-Lm8-n1]